MSRKSSFSKKDLLEIAKGQFRDKSIGKLPLPPMLMIDRIIEISEVGGDYEKGYIKAEMDISCLLYTSPSPRDRTRSRMPSSA